MRARQPHRGHAYRVALSGQLLAVMLVLGYVEHMLPTPVIPGIKLGLSNGVLIFAVCMLDLPTAWTLMALKVTLSGLMFSGLNAMLYAFSGGVFSMLTMTLLSRCRLPCTPVSMAGGAAHNIGQVLLAMRIAHLPYQMFVYMAVLVGAGAVCGLLTGVAADRVMAHTRGIPWLRLAGRGAGSSLRERITGAVIVILAGLLAFWLLPKPSGQVTLTSSLTAQTAEASEEETSE